METNETPTITCKHCGFVNPEGAKNCSSCRRLLEDKTKYCTHCGEKNPEHLNTCVKCGKSFGNSFFKKIIMWSIAGVAIAGVIIAVVIAYLVYDHKRVNNPESIFPQTERRIFKATLSQDSYYNRITINNEDDFTVRDCKVTINSSYSISVDSITMGRGVEIRLTSFSDMNGVRFQPENLKMIRAEIACTTSPAGRVEGVWTWD